MRFVIFIAYEPGGWVDADAATQRQYVDDHAAFERFIESHGRRHESASAATSQERAT